MAIRERIKSERERLGLSQTAFGSLGDVGKTTVIAWERGTAFPNAAFLAAIANAGADVQFIVTGTPSASAIAPDEQVLLDGYRVLDPVTRRRMLAFILGGAAPAVEQPSSAPVVVKASGFGTQAAGRKIVNQRNR